MKILRFNWPWYAATVAVTLTAILLLLIGPLRGLGASVVAVTILIANFWGVASLAVSHYVYDRSPISRGRWLDAVDPAKVQHAAVFHAGQDEASSTVKRALPLAEIQTFDFYDQTRNGTPSLKRARALAERQDVRIEVNNIPFKNETLDLGLVVFAAHEIRGNAERASFFRELGRALTPAGRVIIVEHLRNGWNFLAYGPGAFHFLSANTWRQSFASGELRLARETSCTRFVRIFELKKES